jgi:hypothetical protein
VDGSDEVRLRDGTSLVVRPVRPDDATALVALHAPLSADTIYRRYFVVVGETETQLQDLGLLCLNRPHDPGAATGPRLTS